MEQLREKFGGLEIQVARSPGAATRMGRVRSLAASATPSPPLFQPMAPTLASMTRALPQGSATAGAATPPPMQQQAIPVASAAGGVPALEPVAGLLPGYILVWEKPPPPALVVHFGGHPDNLTHFLAQVWHHMERYGGMYPDDVAQVHAIVANLEGRPSGWLVSLHDAEGPKLANLDAFM